MAIASEVAKTRPELEISFVSYADGATAFKRAGFSVIDLKLSATNPYIDTLVLSRQIISDHKPDLIVSHEEFAALPAARIAKLPSIFISAWLPDPRSGITHESLLSASSIILLGQPGIFALPQELATKPLYVGEIIRKFQFTTSDRSAIRAEMKIPDDVVLLLMVPGAHNREVETPTAHLIFEAFKLLQQNKKMLLWIGDKDYEFIKSCSANVPGVHAVRYVDPIEKLFAASDVVITKGTRGTTLDVSSMGLPSISLSFGKNPIDDILVPRVRTNIALNAAAVTPDILVEYIRNILVSPKPVPVPPTGVEKVTNALISEIDRCLRTR